MLGVLYQVVNITNGKNFQEIPALFSLTGKLQSLSTSPFCTNVLNAKLSLKAIEVIVLKN